jgi:hypothetical protein
VPVNDPKTESGRTIDVWLELKVQVKLDVCGLALSHFIAPSFSTPVLSLLKVNVLSIMHDGITPAGNDSSINPSPLRSIPAVSYFQAEAVINCICVLVVEEELFLLQLFIIKKIELQIKLNNRIFFIKFIYITE